MNGQSNEYNSTHIYISMGRFTPTFTEDILYIDHMFFTNNGISGVD